MTKSGGSSRTQGAPNCGFCGGKTQFKLMINFNILINTKIVYKRRIRILFTKHKHLSCFHLTKSKLKLIPFKQKVRSCYITIQKVNLIGGWKSRHTRGCSRSSHLAGVRLELSIFERVNRIQHSPHL